jgi:molybdopterin molybdotransferase
VLESVGEPLPAEELPLDACHGRTLAGDLAALRTQPPFAASAMDGYAVRAADVTSPPTTLRVIGASIAGRGYRGSVAAGETVRIFTGAPMPDGADAVVIQEDTRTEGETVTVLQGAAQGRFVRPSGLDFRAGETLLHAGQRLDARRLALAAAMGHARLPVRRKPRVAILATGDELVRPGEAPDPDQIVASNIYALAALAGRAGGAPIDLGIARDTFADLEHGIEAARAAGADLLVTLGGASVGEHDLVQSALTRQGMDLGFWRVALRPGKPLMHGRLGPMLLLGLPGNPVSSIVCGVLFVAPAIRAMLGDPSAGADPAEAALLGADLRANDGRQDYLRATLTPFPDGLPLATALPVQDSSMLAVLARADALIVRPPHAPAARRGETCRIIQLAGFV